jgi:fused signal recognition particle receptor
MGLFAKFKAGLQKTHAKLTHEIKRIVTQSPKLTAESLEEIEQALIAADLGMAMTAQIVAAVKQAYETQGSAGLDYLAIARAEIEKSLLRPPTPACSKKCRRGPRWFPLWASTAPAKPPPAPSWRIIFRRKKNRAARRVRHVSRGGHRADQTVGHALKVEVIASGYGADAAAVAHDAVTAAQARQADYLFIDTAGRLHTKHNLMQELQKLHRVIGKQLAGAPHEVLLVLDASTGMNALNQAREFNKAVPLTGLIVTKLDGTSKGGMVVAIQKELGLPIKFIGLGEQPDDLQPFDAKQFAQALFEE